MVEKLRSPCYLKSPAENLLGIFAKEPLPGKVKTRLIPPFTAEQAAELYRTSLVETVGRLRHGPWRPVLFYAGRRPFFAEAFPDLELQAQSGGDLGQRMAQAFLFLLARGQRAILVGSDSPDLPRAHLRQGFAALQRDELVVAPAADGGYILIGERRHHPEIFADIPWSTAEVLPRTRRRAAELGLACAEMAPWEDFDDFPSLQRLRQRSPHSATARRAAELLVATACPPAAAGGRRGRAAGED